MMIIPTGVGDQGFGLLGPICDRRMIGCKPAESCTLTVYLQRIKSSPCHPDMVM